MPDSKELNIAKNMHKFSIMTKRIKNNYFNCIRYDEYFLSTLNVRIFTHNVVKRIAYRIINFPYRYTD